MIVLFILGISYPLSLYRDIAKVCQRLWTTSKCVVKRNANSAQLAKASTLALISMLVIVITVITQGARIPADLRGSLKGNLFINNGVFQAISVISFGTLPSNTRNVLF